MTFKLYRRKYDNPWERYKRSNKKLISQLERGKAQILDSGFTDTQTIYALKKAWVGYKIAISNYEYERKEYYSAVINRLEEELGREKTYFQELERMASLSRDRESYLKEITNDKMRELVKHLNKHRYEYRGF